MCHKIWAYLKLANYLHSALIFMGGRTPNYVKKYLRLSNETTRVGIYRLAITVDGANVRDL